MFWVLECSVQGAEKHYRELGRKVVSFQGAKAPGRVSIMIDRTVVACGFTSFGSSECVIANTT